MKILIIARGIPSDKDPQEGCFEWDQAKALSDKGHNVFILAVDSRVRKFWRPLGINLIEKDNIKAYKIFYFPTSIIRRLVSMRLGYAIEAYFARKLYRYLIKHYGNFDIVHSHYLNCSYFGTTIKNHYGCNLVGTEHWSEVNKPILSNEIKYLGLRTYHNLDGLISVSNDLRNSIKRHFGVSSYVVHNLINTSLLQPALKKTNNQSYTIIGLGSLIKRKGFDILIKAFDQSYLRNKNVVLKIIGSGPEYNSLINLIQERHLEEKVLLCGQKNKKDVYNELHKADLFVLSSKLENFSVAIIEATANGVPAIGTLCGGIQEYPVESVIKIPVDDINIMSNAIESCYLNRNNINRISIQNETLHYFSQEAITSQLEEIYNKVLNKNILKDNSIN